MKDFWATEVAPRCQPLGLLRYVVDLGVTSISPPRVVVVELNPNDSKTGAGMFSWEDESDVSVLEGRKPFEFRVLEQPRENLEPYLQHLLEEGLVEDTVDQEKKVCGTEQRTCCIL